ncbi:hypothetical protein [Pseudidiomarina andamanensis]|uniref:Uncharacterized protein n=1 Tax=Pseudidiomarina andamanensis TaxID=1940690 RepID=A0AA92EQB5_9GAMM|nr:hypothetical protein [Pseudidiomarina andamanensis]MDS0217784.1 hypothetical protein [Pseudidiomarina andamanensis]QGT94691.1 hypothetical protein D3795_00130 [Pseudidiomarina andamanensis]
MSEPQTVQTEQINEVKSAHKTRRKISLYNGTEKLSDLGVPLAESNGAAIKRAMAELQRSPILTHAVFRDRKGKQWVIPRAISFIKRLKIQFFAN